MDQKKSSFLSNRQDAFGALRRFLPDARNYGKSRNGVEKGNPRVSRLSEAVRARLISEYEVADQVMDVHGLDRVEKYIQEVYWRLYWKGWLEWHPKVWSDYLTEVKFNSKNDSVVERCRVVEEGRSGVKIMDRFAQELVNTGYLHNHARMWLAGYWIHICGLPWSLGADFFYRHLLDADPASNTLSWRWVAGLQTRGKSYLPNANNLRKFCKYPEVREPMLDQQLEPDFQTEVQYAVPDRLELWPETTKPTLDQPYLLWVHGEDLSFWHQYGNLPEREPDAVVLVQDEQLANKYGISGKRIQFMYEALMDARTRWMDSHKPPVVYKHGSLIENIIDTARTHKVTVVAGMLPAIGPLRSLVPDLRRQLQRHGIELELWRRKQDEEILPLARRGFFPFWKEVRTCLL
ncbi:MAG: FAD-binding domain-containing protein [Verrucomicrobiota bacterium]